MLILCVSISGLSNNRYAAFHQLQELNNNPTPTTHPTLY